MKTSLAGMIERVARVRGCSFYEAARWLGRCGGRRRRAQRAEAARLTAVRSTWAWKRDFE